MRKKFWGILLAATCMALSVTGCTLTSNYEEPEVDTLNEVHNFDGEEITARKLFDAAMETVRYAKYLDVQGKYKFTDDLDIGYSIESTRKNIKSEGALFCKIYRDEDGNFSSVLNGEVTYDENYKSNMIHNVNYDKHKQAKFFYYKTKDSIDSKDKFLYYGDGDICGPIDIEAIFRENLDGKKVESFTKEDGLYIVKVTGNFTIVSTALGRSLEGSGLQSKIIYKFDCKTHELLGVDLKGYYSKDKSAQTIVISSEDKYFSLSLALHEVSNKKVDLPEIPEIVSSNGFTNDIIVNGQEFGLNEGISNPFGIENEFYSVAGAIWSDILEVPESDRNTIAEIKEVITNAASAYEIDEVNCEYATIGYGDKGDGHKGVLIRYQLNDQGETAGYIIIPISGGYDGIKSRPVIALDKNDYGRFNVSGRMQFVHDFTPDCQYMVQSFLTDEGGIQDEYSYVKETRLSNLSDQAEVVNFPENDWEALQKMASDLDIARVSGITRYVIRENEDDGPKANAYYVIDSDLHTSDIEEIENEYGIDMALESTVKSKLSKAKFTGEENSVSWVQILDE